MERLQEGLSWKMNDPSVWTSFPAVGPSASNGWLLCMVLFQYEATVWQTAVLSCVLNRVLRTAHILVHCSVSIWGNTWSTWDLHTYGSISAINSISSRLVSISPLNGAPFFSSDLHELTCALQKVHELIGMASVKWSGWWQVCTQYLGTSPRAIYASYALCFAVASESWGRAQQMFIVLFQCEATPGKQLLAEQGAEHTTHTCSLFCSNMNYEPTSCPLFFVLFQWEATSGQQLLAQQGGPPVQAQGQMKARCR